MFALNVCIAGCWSHNAQLIEMPYWLSDGCAMQPEYLQNLKLLTAPCTWALARPEANCSYWKLIYAQLFVLLAAGATIQLIRNALLA